MITESLNIIEKSNSKTKVESNYVSNRPLLTEVLVHAPT